LGKEQLKPTQSAGFYPNDGKKINMLRLGIVSDEISLDFQEAIRYAIDWGIQYLELRCLKSGRIPDVSKSEFSFVKKAIAENGLMVSALSPGIFKHHTNEKQLINQQLKEVLPKTCDLAHEIKSKIVIVFGFKRRIDNNVDDLARAAEYLSKAADKGKGEGICIAVENEPGFLCDTGSSTAKMIQMVNSEYLRANWDPCNAYGANETPFPNGYLALRNFIANVHVKDTKEGALIKCLPVGEGCLDWKGQLRALIEDKFDGNITIETHCHPQVEQSKKNVDIIRGYMCNIEREEN
jgi:L-ribulose-5-phosphate 3-epimerase